MILHRNMKFTLTVLLLVSAVFAVPVHQNDFQIEPRIAGGQLANPHQFPYQVGLKLTKFVNGGIFSAWCGGSLIADQVVLTAAHCLEGTSGGTVYLGAHNRDEPKEADRIMMKIKKGNMIIHEKYDNFFHTDDIALIILPQKVQLSDKITTINLPSTSGMHLEGRMAIASGWGKIGDGKPGSSVLRYAEQKIVKDGDCMKSYGIILPSQVCVDTSNGKSTCQGDSGGPLVLEDDDGKKTLVGLTSYGKTAGCEKGIPVIFTRISAYLEWIKEKANVSI